MVTLALSTSTARGGAAVLEGDKLLGASGYVDLAGHAERIFAAIDEALAAAKVEREAIDAIAVDIGPGSFTGVRVGVATAKGIAIALDVPIRGVVSLEAMAFAAFGEGAASAIDHVIACLDAKKSEVFTGVYELDEARGVRTIAAPSHAPMSDGLAGLATTAAIVVAGEIGSSIAGTLRNPRSHALDLPDAAWIGRLAALRESQDAAAIEPLYVRAPDAKPIAPPKGS